MSKLSLHILHQEYLLTCPDGREDQLREAVERVDQQLQQMRDTSTLRSRERIGVLLAVNLAFENLELRNQLQALQLQLANAQGTADSAQADAMAEQLQLLTTQAAHDQQIAHALLQRLDQVLTPEAVDTGDVSALAPDADLANAEDMELPSGDPETR